MIATADATVLHVEDDVDNRQSLAWILRAEGFHVVEAERGDEALRLAACQPPDLVLLDVGLPDMSGFEVCHRLKSQPETSSIPVLQLSGHFVEADDRVQGFATGADAYLMKPVDPRELVAHLRALLRVHRAEQAAQAAARQWQTTFDAVGDGICVLGPGGEVLRCNRAMAAILGQPVAQLIGRDFPALCRRLFPTAPAGWLSAPPGGAPVELPLGGRWYRIRVNAAEDSAGHVDRTLVWDDITEHNRLEEQLRQAVKMEAVGRLAGGIAHDFNNQLTVINGYAGLLLDRLPPDDPAREALEEIRRSGEHAATLTRQLLAFSRKQILAPRVLNLNTVLGEMGKMLRRLLGDDVELALELDPALGTVNADAGQVEQVLVNLAVNARDAMAEGGTLTIRTFNVELADPPAELAAGPYVALEVRDTGCGMSAEVRARIFEPFFTTKGVGKGTGLGLAMVYGIVKQSGGHVDVRSAPGQGTTFRILLPRTRARPAPAPAVPAAPRGTETVLLVEDEPGVRTLAATMLRACGYAVLTAAEGAEAEQVSDGHAGPIHLLLSDVMMPRLTGPQLAERLRSRRPGLRVLFISGYTAEALASPAALAGAELLYKPFTPAELAIRVRQVLDRPAGS